MDILISTFERAITNAVELLTRTRFHKNAPLYLIKAQCPLAVTVAERAHGHARVNVSCKTWGSTILTITLSEAHDNWLPWGSFAVMYGSDYPVASLAGTSLRKDIYPMYANNPEAVRHQELRIRSRAR